MTAAWHEHARALKAADPSISYGAIARRVGATPGGVWKLFNREQARASDKRQDARPCACGGQRVRRAERCMECARAVAAVRRSLAEGMWADGWSGSEIARVLGWKRQTSVNAMRAHGWDLPHRYRLT